MGAYRLTPRGRLWAARYPLSVLLALVAVGAWSRPPLGSPRTWLFGLVLVLLLAQAVRALRGSELVIDGEGVRRGPVSLGWSALRLELRAVPAGATLRLYAASVRDPGGAEIALEEGLAGFHAAVRELLGRVPEADVAVVLPRLGAVRDGRAEALVEALRAG